MSRGESSPPYEPSLPRVSFKIVRISVELTSPSCDGVDVDTKPDEYLAGHRSWCNCVNGFPRHRTQSKRLSSTSRPQITVVSSDTIATRSQSFEKPKHRTQSSEAGHRRQHPDKLGNRRGVIPGTHWRLFEVSHREKYESIALQGKCMWAGVVLAQAASTRAHSASAP